MTFLTLILSALTVLSLSLQGLIVTLQPLSVKGSLKDMVYGSNPLLHYGKKYKVKGRPLTPRKVAMIGRQIIEAIQFLRSKGLKYENLHSGNVIMDENGVARWVGVVNCGVLATYPSFTFPRK